MATKSYVATILHWTLVALASRRLHFSQFCLMIIRYITQFVILCNPAGLDIPARRSYTVPRWERVPDIEVRKIIKGAINVYSKG